MTDARMIALIEAAQRVCSTWPATAEVCGLRAALESLTPPASELVEALEDAVIWARDEFADKERMARCRKNHGLADYYGGCKDRMNAALALTNPKES